MLSRRRLFAFGGIGLLIVIAMIGGIVVTSHATIAHKPSNQRAPAVSTKPEQNPPPLDEKEKEWKSRLTEEQYMVTRQKATEPAFSGKYWNNKAHGIYKCVCCKTPLFNSNTKFDSGTGWPSFYEPIDERKIETAADFSLFTLRTEVLCRSCRAHLGHVFEDGPRENGGLRYCINSAALDFQETFKTGE
jgi:peptide-methionine (R)-S-oxide reductase